MFSRLFVLLCLFVLCLALKKPRVNGGEGGARQSTSDEKNAAPRGTKTPKTHRPVVLVPGLGGSQLWAKLTDKRSVPHVWCDRSTKRYYNIWLSLILMLPKVIDCTIDNMRLYYDAASHTTRDTQGVDIQALRFGDPESVEWLDPFLPHAQKEVYGRGVENSSSSASLLLGDRASQQTRKWMRGDEAKRVGGAEWVNSPLPFGFLSDLSYYADISKALVSNGYTRGKDLVATPYDFRKAPNEMSEFFNMTKRLIENTYSTNNGTRVVVVAHSMGNPIMLYFYNRVVSQEWKDRYVHAHVALSAPWGGAVKPLLLMVTGDNMGLVYVKKSAMRIFQRSMPSVAWLLPSQGLWSGSEPLVTTPQRNYTASQYRQLFADLGYTDGYSMWMDSKGLISGLKFPGIEMHVLYGTSVKTPGRLVYSDKEFPDHTPQMVADDGDGTVNRRSLEAFRKWEGQTQQHSGGTSRPVKSLALPQVTHLGILKDPQAIQYVVQVALQ